MKKIVLFTSMFLGSVLVAFFTLTSSAVQTTIVCDDLRPLNGSSQDATGIVQSCVDQAINGQVLFPPGVYTLAGRVLVTGPIVFASERKGLLDPACQINDSSCAHFRAARESTLDTQIRGVFQFTGSRVIVHHVIFDGNKDERRLSQAGRTCSAGNNRVGFLLSSTASSLRFQGNVVKRALCGTGFEVIHGADVIVEDNKIWENGLHLEHMLWADGLTSDAMTRLTVKRNHFHDNTDVQLIFGSCTGCDVADNTFTHSEDPNLGSYAELMIHAWPGGVGDYRNSYFHRNVIDCGPAHNCGVGILIGGDSWYPNTPAAHPIVRDNTVRRAIIAVSVDEATGPFEIYNTTLEDLLIGQFRCFGSGVVTDSAVYNIAPKSMSLAGAETLKQRNQMAPSYVPGAFSQRDFDGCIPTPPFLPGARPAEVGGPGPSPTPTPGPTPSSCQAPPVPASCQWTWSNPRTCQGQMDCLRPAQRPSNRKIVDSFVTTLYTGLLGRRPETEGFTIWMSRLEEQSLSCFDVGSEFLKSAEYKEKSALRGDEEFLDSLYLGLLGRSPDLEGKASWLGQLKSGRDRGFVEKWFLHSPEFLQRCD